MTDHYAEACAAMDAATEIRANLAHVYGTPGQRHPVAIASLRDDLRHALTWAKLHSNLAAVQQAREQVQALEDLRGEIAALAQDLNGEPPPRPGGLRLEAVQS